MVRFLSPPRGASAVGDLILALVSLILAVHAAAWFGLLDRTKGGKSRSVVVPAKAALLLPQVLDEHQFVLHSAHGKWLLLHVTLMLLPLLVGAILGLGHGDDPNTGPLGPQDCSPNLGSCTRFPFLAIPFIVLVLPYLCRCCSCHTRLVSVGIGSICAHTDPPHAACAHTATPLRARSRAPPVN